MFALLEKQGWEFTQVKLLKNNAYCQIYHAFLQSPFSKEVIVKFYRSDQEGFSLASAEYQGLQHYQTLAGKVEGLAACKPLGLLQENNINALIFEYFTGRPLTIYFQKAIFSSFYRQKLFVFIARIVAYLQVNRSCVSDLNWSLSGFFANYLRYCSSQLAKHSYGRLWCRHFPAEAEQLCQSLANAEMGNSGQCWIHGDLVPANILVNDKEELCFIDFANTQRDGHVLSDIYGFLRSIQLFQTIPNIYQPIIDIFDELSYRRLYSATEQAFFYELHRRRWLWLKITSWHPWHQLEAGMAFLSPFDDG